MALTLGNDGIFGRSQNAVNTWTNAERQEQESINSYVSQYDSTYQQYKR